MCDLGAYTTSFKGVVIDRSIFLLLFTFSSIIDVRSMSINLKDNTNKLNIKNKVGYPYCVYLEQSKELDCTCQNIKDTEPSGFASSDAATDLIDLLSGVDSFQSLNTLRTQHITKITRLEENRKRNFTHGSLHAGNKLYNL